MPGFAVFFDGLEQQSGFRSKHRHDFNDSYYISGCLNTVSFIQKQADAE